MFCAVTASLPLLRVPSQRCARVLVAAGAGECRSAGRRWCTTRSSPPHSLSEKATAVGGSTVDASAAGSSSPLVSSTSGPAHAQQRRPDRSGRRRRRSSPRRGARRATDASPPQRREGTEEAVPRSLDISAVEDMVDVERFFPQAVAHLKAAPLSADAADASRARRWHEATHDYNADNIVTPAKLAERERRDSGSHSFFDEAGGLDVRGGMADKLRSGRHGGAREEAERLSPDVLRLTGGSARRHGGLRLAAESNASPADQTIEGDSGDAGADSEFGDTPVQLTDMLRERLMELKAETLREERNETFLPQRLRHRSAEEELLRLATGAEEAAAPQRRVASKTARPKPPTSLADLATEADAEAAGASLSGEWSGGEDAAILRDGLSAERVAKAAAVVRSSGDHVPGGSTHDPLQRLARAAAHAGPRASLLHDAGGDVPPSGESDAAGAVHLLRTLPRAGFCSRREAAAVIASGQVRVNNVVERNPFRVVRAEDDIHVSGHTSRLRFAPPRLWMYHKPANVIVSRNDVAGRTLITKHARILGMDHLVPVGSLPMRAHGILLLTNDGELSRFLENPATMVQRTYLLRVRPAMDPVLVHKLNSEGIQINGKRYRNAEFFVNPATKSRYSVKVKVRGESMPIAHLMQHLGRTVERGGRISYGPFALSNLAVGSIREVTVPPFYMEHLGAVWKPFVERDWPYFRRQRVSRLRRLARYRELSPSELEELDNYTYEEVKDALRFESSELETLAAQRAASMQRARYLDDEELPPLPGTFQRGGGQAASSSGDISTEDDIPYDDAIVEDITAVL